jgi:predicted dehydrogenase
MRLAIVGTGFGVYGVLPAFLRIKDCEVVAFCGRSTERFYSYLYKQGLRSEQITVYSDWRQMLALEKIDAIAIAVIPEHQFEIAKTSLEAGIHVFAEKPLAVSVEHAEILHNLAKKNNCITALDFIFPEIQEWKMAKCILEDKVLGGLKSVQVDWDFLSYDIANELHGWKTSSSQGGGAASFYVSHMLHYLESFAGKIVDVSSKLTYSSKSLGGAEVGVDAVFQTDTGVICNLHFSCVSVHDKQHKVVLVCEQGTVVLASNGSVTTFSIAIYGKQVDPLYMSAIQEKCANQILAFEGEDERVPYVYQIANRFVHSILTHERMQPSFQEGVRVQELIKLVRGNGLQGS